MTCTIHSQVKLSSESKHLLENFIMFCKQKLDIDQLPQNIIIFKHRDEEKGMTTGGYNPETTDIMVLGGHRMLLDILRSIAHELTHHKQHERGTLLDMVAEYDTDIDSPYENEAYERAGNLIKEWTRIIKDESPIIYELYAE